MHTTYTQKGLLKVIYPGSSQILNQSVNISLEKKKKNSKQTQNKTEFNYTVKSLILRRKATNFSTLK